MALAALPEDPRSSNIIKQLPTAYITAVPGYPFLGLHRIYMDIVCVGMCTCAYAQQCTHNNKSNSKQQQQ